MVAVPVSIWNLGPFLRFDLGTYVHDLKIQANHAMTFMCHVKGA